MPKASELKRGTVVEINGVPHAVKQIEAKSPSSRGASTLYKIRFNNLQTGQKLDESYKSDDFLKEADCVRVSVQYSYKDGDNHIFMNNEDFSQYEVNANDIEEQMGYISEGMDREIVDTVPALKGATATGRTKPATLTTGMEVQVPEYIEVGELIKINTGTGKFMSRA